MATNIADDNTPYKLIVEQSSTPATPGAGKQIIFISSSDHQLKVVNSAGAVSAVGGTSTPAALKVYMAQTFV